MAQLLNDKEIKKLLGTVIINGDKDSIRPNSYIMRMGGVGAFLDSKKDKKFDIGENQGIKLPAGYAVAVTALETIDFRQETVDKIYPGCSLHGFLTPTTDLSREGLTVPGTQVDAGYRGTLNWTIHNSSSGEACFAYGDRLFRLTILKLDKAEEVPEHYYDGAYQGKEGHVSSKRRGLPTGMRESDLSSPVEGDSMEEKLEHLIDAGYPWDIFGEKLREIDQGYNGLREQVGELKESMQDKYDELKEAIDDLTVKYGELKEAIDDLTVKYGELKEAIDDLTVKYGELKEAIDDLTVKYGRLTEAIDDLTVKYGRLTEKYDELKGLYDELKKSVQNLDNNLDSKLDSKLKDIKINGLLALLGSAGVLISILTNDTALEFMKEYGWLIGLIMISVVSVMFYQVNFKK